MMKKYVALVKKDGEIKDIFFHECIYPWEVINEFCSKIGGDGSIVEFVDDCRAWLYSDQQIIVYEIKGDGFAII